MLCHCGCVGSQTRPQIVECLMDSLARRVGPWYLDPAEVLASGEPSHRIVATAADVAMHYQGMLHSDVWSRRAITEGTRVGTRAGLRPGRTRRHRPPNLNGALRDSARGRLAARLDACHRIARFLRSRRRTVPAVVLRPSDGNQLRIPHQRLPGVGLRPGPVGQELVGGAAGYGGRACLILADTLQHGPERGQPKTAPSWTNSSISDSG